MMLSATGLELCSLCPGILSYRPPPPQFFVNPKAFSPNRKGFLCEQGRDAVVACAHMGGGNAKKLLPIDQKLLLASRDSAINEGVLSCWACEDTYHPRATETGLLPQASQRPSSTSPHFPLPDFPSKSFRDGTRWGKPEAKLGNYGTKRQARKDLPRRQDK